MDTTEFKRDEIGPGLAAHSFWFANNIGFHIMASWNLSLEDILSLELQKDLMIEISGLDDRHWSIFMDDPVLQAEQARKTGAHLFLAISNKKLPSLFKRVCELAAQ